MRKNLAIVAILALFASSCDDNGGDDEAATFGTDGADIPTSEADAGDQLEVGVNTGKESSIEPLCPGGVATETLILVETVDELAALSDCTSLNGLGILVSESTTLDALHKVKTIKGDLAIKDCGMSTLHGLDNLTDVEGDLLIENCSGLISLDGLENLKTIGGRLTIKDNASLSDVKALGGLQSIGLQAEEGLIFKTNLSLATCAAQAVATNLAIEDEALIVICGNMVDDCDWDACDLSC
jgi:hypothetical protein